MGFFIARYICKNKEIDTTYSIGLGLVFYASLYLYFLFFNNSLLPFFTNTLIYFVGIDLLLTSFFSFKETESQHFGNDLDFDNEFEFDNLIEKEEEEFKDDVSDIIEVSLVDTDTYTKKDVLIEDVTEDVTEEDVTEEDVTEDVTENVTEDETEEIDDTLSTMFKEYEQTEETVIVKPKRGRKKKVTINESN